MQAAKRILLIDDDDDVREVLSRFLQEHGYEVSTATCGDEALASMMEDPPDLALLDLSMPGLSGLDVMRWMKEQHIDVPIIAISGHPAASMIVPDSLRLGAEDFISKPFDLAVVGKKLEERLGA